MLTNRLITRPARLTLTVLFVPGRCTRLNFSSPTFAVLPLLTLQSVTSVLSRPVCFCVFVRSG